MLLTRKNLIEEFPKVFPLVSSKLPADFNDRFEAAKKNLAFYDRSDIIAKQIDKFCEKVNEKLKEVGQSDEPTKTPKKTTKPATKTPKKAAKPATKKAPKTAKPATKKTSKTVKKKPKTKTKPKPKKGVSVSKVTPEVLLFRRYVRLNDKQISTHKRRAVLLLNALQRAIIERTIRKTSTHAKEIMDMQKHLIDVATSNGGTIKINNIERIKNIAESQHQSDVVSIVKSYIVLHHKTDVKERARKLLNRAKLCSNSLLNPIVKSLEDYISGKTSYPNISEQQLTGLMGYYNNKKAYIQ